MIAKNIPKNPICSKYRQNLGNKSIIIFEPSSGGKGKDRRFFGRRGY